MKLGLKPLQKAKTFEELVDSITETKIPVLLFDEVEDLTLSEEELAIINSIIADSNNITDAGFEGEPDGLI